MPRVLALSGGVGGARLCEGLYRALNPGELSVLVNVADDFRLYGLHISPDLDTNMYHLAGLADPEQGWGIAGDTWACARMLERYGVEQWFRLGDRDLATHLRRTQLLAEGQGLAQVTAELCRRLGIHATLLPMCEEPVSTVVETPAGTLSFQDYFVRRRHQDRVTGVRYQGIEKARPSPGVARAIEEAEVLIYGPSNPFLSLFPILKVPGMEELLQRFRGPRVAVSPIVAGRALKGPLARNLESLGYEVSALGVARLYQGRVEAFVIDEEDRALSQAIEEETGMRVLVCPTVMSDETTRLALAHHILEWVALHPELARG
ncbi:MAG TPA: 2-phospho-L-lactate transferase [Candidatus Nitrosotenuis sp.]|jgi:LPPG:FO 2-phospho-L-lactate transferase|nr:2-phospho-L-lactate transferase [Candidatus Nitrosotenuis sp.]